ncbi:MAG: aminotransferase class III-fold pyridoxal phosphate-dependent enzyme [Pseudoruegeria sp.]
MPFYDNPTRSRQGEGGCHQALAALVHAIRARCGRYGNVMIADEIQTGFVRTGNLFAMDGNGVAADLITMTKGLAGGFALAVVVEITEIMGVSSPGGLGGTYCGNPLGINLKTALLFLNNQLV